MNKNLAKNFAFFKDIDCDLEPVSQDREYVPLETRVDCILSDIFSVDEVSGLPKGDLAYYLSENGNPEVREWLQNNLLKPRGSSSGTSVEGVTDDMLAEYQRNSGESINDYRQRLYGYFVEAKKFADSKKEDLNK